MTSFRESRSPAVPSRSPFRIRDSHLSKMTDNIDRWSFTSELDSLWNMKPKAAYNKTDTENDTMFSSSNLLVELLISQAILDSSEFKALSFDNLEALKKELKVIHDSIHHTTKNLQLENRIKNISKSLENANLKSSRHSVLYLADQRQSNENKIKQMSEFLEGLKERQVEIKKGLLQHTAAVLSKGIQNMELTAAKKRRNQLDYSDMLLPLQNELDLIARKVNKICASKFNINLSSSTVEKLLQLEKRLQTNGTGNQMAALNHLGNPKSFLNESNTHKISHEKMQLIAIEQQKDSYYNKMVDLELLTTKLLSHVDQFSQRQKALQMECMLYKTESIELEIWHKTWERDCALNTDNHPPSSQSDEIAHHQQLQQQAEKYESEINQQNILIQRNTRRYQQLEVDIHRLSDQKVDLESTIHSKSRLLDEKDRRITQLHLQLQSQKQASQTSNRYDTQLREQEKKRLNESFQQREACWTSHTHKKEDQFDELLESFDRLTNMAMEFDTDRMRYDKRISQLNHNVSELEMELITHKIKRLGFNNQEPPTTQLLRKEFRQLVADIKEAHQIRMEQEAEEIRRLQLQLEELHNTNHNTAYKYQQHISTQTDYWN